MPGRRVLVHVGAPKTGTSFVQDLLFQNRKALADQGILYPADRFDGHFLAALDLMELHWGGLEKEAVGAWDRTAASVRDWAGTSIISHEILATASRAQVRRAFDSFGDAEVHLVLSARDLVRQIPAEWQENVKHRRTVSYADFLSRITDPSRTGSLASWFWGVQEVPDILDRWGSTLPPQRVHLVTVPKPGQPRGLLWERFAGVLGIDPAEYAPGSEHTNPSLGVPETALIRRINQQVNGGVLASNHYREFVRELLAHQAMSGRTGSARLSVPPQVWSWAVDVSEAWISELGTRGYDVVGTLEDLRPDPAPTPFVDPDSPDQEQVADAATASIVALLKEAARLRVELDLTSRDRDEAWTVAGRRLSYRMKQRLVRSAKHGAVGRAALEIYRKVRGRSSRSA